MRGEEENKGICPSFHQCPEGAGKRELPLSSVVSLPVHLLAVRRILEFTSVSFT